MNVIYLDNNATSRPAPEVVEAVLPFYRDRWGNPSSLHRYGRDVVGSLEEAREQAAQLIGARRPVEIVFTSGGTEGDNTVLRGAIAARPHHRHIITSAVEHSAVLHCCRNLEKEGYRVTYLGVTRNGQLDLAEFESALCDDTAIVSIMWANNETGTIFPIEHLAAVCRSRGIPFHTDAVQAVGKVPIDVNKAPVDFLSVSGHKFHAPKGVGFLYIRRGSPFRPLIVGGGQENARRAGTENVAQIVGLGMAAQLARHSVTGPQASIDRVRQLRDRLEDGLKERLTGVHVNGDITARVPNTTNLSIEGVDGEAVILGLSDVGVCASTGSACSSGSMEPSHVLVAMRLPQEHLRGTLRLSVSRYTIDEEITRALEMIPQVVERLRKFHPSRKQ